jgi:hypothetical protein
MSIFLLGGHLVAPLRQNLLLESVPEPHPESAEHVNESLINAN